MATSSMGSVKYSTWNHNTHWRPLIRHLSSLDEVYGRDTALQSAILSDSLESVKYSA